jgi:lipopolysaccharide export LptBFGC system permease protein LptF
VNKPSRILAAALTVVAMLYCVLTMGTTWTEAGFIDPLIAVCFLASVAIMIYVIRGRSRVSK